MRDWRRGDAFNLFVWPFVEIVLIAKYVTDGVRVMARPGLLFRCYCFSTQGACSCKPYLARSVDQLSFVLLSAMRLCCLTRLFFCLSWSWSTVSHACIAISILTCVSTRVFVFVNKRGETLGHHIRLLFTPSCHKTCDLFCCNRSAPAFLLLAKSWRRITVHEIALLEQVIVLRIRLGAGSCVRLSVSFRPDWSCS